MSLGVIGFLSTLLLVAVAVLKAPPVEKPSEKLLSVVAIVTGRSPLRRRSA